MVIFSRVWLTFSEKSIIMPGENCAFPKCSTSRKDKGVSLSDVPAPDKTNDESMKWTKDLINIALLPNYSVFL